MKITRIGTERNTEHEANIIDVVIDNKRYRLSEKYGQLEVMSIDGKLSIHPSVANVVTIEATE